VVAEATLLFKPNAIKNVTKDKPPPAPKAPAKNPAQKPANQIFLKLAILKGKSASSYLYPCFYLISSSADKILQANKLKTTVDTGNKNVNIQKPAEHL